MCQKRRLPLRTGFRARERLAQRENDVSFEYRHLEEPGPSEELASLWPLQRFPVLVDDGRTVVEIEHHYRTS